MGSTWAGQEVGPPLAVGKSNGGARASEDTALSWEFFFVFIIIYDHEEL